MKNFEGFMEEVEKFLEQTEEILSGIVKEQNAEQEKKGVSWDELSNWIAESEYIEEFKVDTNAEDLTYTTEDVDDDGLCDCEYCTRSCDCEYCTEPEEFNYEDDDFNYDEYDEYRDQMEAEDEYDDCNKQESEPAPESLSLLDYREALFRHVEERNPEHRPEAHLKLTEIFSNVIWEILAGPNTATPEEISEAHVVFRSSRYLLASVKSQLDYRGLEIDLLGIENEIENYLKEEK